METMQEPLCISISISNKQKCYVFLIISYDFSSTKLENNRAEQALPGCVEGLRGCKRGWWTGGEVAQTMYTHMNKCKTIKNKLKKKDSLWLIVSEVTVHDWLAHLCLGL
jgi:hypothetical protein